MVRVHQCTAEHGGYTQGGIGWYRQGGVHTHHGRQGGIYTRYTPYVPPWVCTTCYTPYVPPWVCTPLYTTLCTTLGMYHPFPSAHSTAFGTMGGYPSAHSTPLRTMGGTPSALSRIVLNPHINRPKPHILDKTVNNERKDEKRQEYPIFGRIRVKGAEIMGFSPLVYARSCCLRRGFSVRSTMLITVG